MEKINAKQLLLDKVTEHVSEKFDLNDDYRVTNFKAKDNSITLDSVNYEITVKCKGHASETIHQEVYKIEKELRQAKELEEEFAE